MGRFLFGNWFSRGYLILVAAVAVVVGILLLLSGPDASLAAVWLFAVTLPGSVLVIRLIGDSLAPSGGLAAATVTAAVVVGALINTAVISGIVRLIRRTRRTTST